MLRVIGCITQQHDLGLVLLAACLCLFACATAMSMIVRTRISVGRERLFWLGAAGMVAGCGIWATHFVAMLAFNPGFPVGYDKGFTALSIIIAILLCSAGFALSLRRGFAPIGGALTGAAISAMHYVGMAALRTPANAIWDHTYIVASVLIGVGFSAAAMQVLLKSRTMLGYVQGSLLFTLAICGMHFTGMTAVTFIPNPEIALPAAILDPSSLAIAVAAGAVLIVGLGLIGVLVDNHLAQRAMSEAEKLRAYIQELESTKAQLENSSQNLAVALAAADSASRSKSQFVATMSHELRTPLNAVIGFADVMLHETFGSLGHPRYHTYVQDIRDSGAHLLSMINNVLDLTRLDTGALKLDEEVLSVSEIVADVLRVTAHQAKITKVALTADIEALLPRVRVDSVRIRQIFTNLVANALKFTPQGGSVHIGAKRHADGLALFVSDTGIGIAAVDIPKALDRFGQVDSSLARRYEGAGLGLPLAKLMTELHGGRLEIQSEESVGTTVTAILPANRLIAEQQAA
jgi:signal transduction histidine kinase